MIGMCRKSGLDLIRRMSGRSGFSVVGDTAACHRSGRG